MMNISIPIAATLIFNKSNTALRNFAHYLKPYYGGGGISHLYTRERKRERGMGILSNSPFRKHRELLLKLVPLRPIY